MAAGIYRRTLHAFSGEAHCALESRQQQAMPHTRKVHKARSRSVEQLESTRRELSTGAWGGKGAHSGYGCSISQILQLTEEGSNERLLKPQSWCGRVLGAGRLCTRVTDLDG